MKRNSRKYIKIIAVLILVFGITGITAGCGKAEDNSEAVHIESETIVDDVDAASREYIPEPNKYMDLSVPTQVTKIDDMYFVVDCYHNQVIYNFNLDDPVQEWPVMTTDINMGHTVAGDGEVFLVDDTENNRVLVFEYVNCVFINTQVLNDIGNRPHYIVYCEEDKSFYVWSSMTGQMYVMKHDEGSRKMYISRILTLDELNGVYVRSFTIEGSSIYLVSGNSEIIEADKETFGIKKRYQVPDTMAGMIQIMPVECGYYITVSTDALGDQNYATILYTQKLDDLIEEKYTDIYSAFIGGGTPYYMGEIDGRYYLTEHRLLGHAIWSFDIGNDGMPENVEEEY